MSFCSTLLASFFFKSFVCRIQIRNYTRIYERSKTIEKVAINDALPLRPSDAIPLSSQNLLGFAAELQKSPMSFHLAHIMLSRCIPIASHKNCAPLIMASVVWGDTVFCLAVNWCRPLMDFRPCRWELGVVRDVWRQWIDTWISRWLCKWHLIVGEWPVPLTLEKKT